MELPVAVEKRREHPLTLVIEKPLTHAQYRQLRESIEDALGEKVVVVSGCGRAYWADDISWG